jgi:hypothetical protein
MRKLLWIAVFAALGYGAFWYLTLDRSPQYPQGIATEFGRALLRGDQATLNGLLIGNAREDLPRLERELAGHPGGPAGSFSISSGGGSTRGGDMTKNLHFYNSPGTPIMTVSAHMHEMEEGWKIDRLMITSH